MLCGISVAVFVCVLALLDEIFNIPLGSPFNYVALFFMGLIRIWGKLSGNICGGDVAHCMGEGTILFLIFASAFIFYGLLGAIMGMIWRVLKNKKFIILWYILIFFALVIVSNIIILLALGEA